MGGNLRFDLERRDLLHRMLEQYLEPGYSFVAVAHPKSALRERLYLSFVSTRIVVECCTMRYGSVFVKSWSNKATVRTLCVNTISQVPVGNWPVVGEAWPMCVQATLSEASAAVAS